MYKPLYNDLKSLIRPNKEVYRESGPWVFYLLDFYLAPSGRLTSTASTSAAASAQVLDWQIHTYLNIISVAMCGPHGTTELEGLKIFCKILTQTLWRDSQERTIQIFKQAIEIIKFRDQEI